MLYQLKEIVTTSQLLVPKYVLDDLNKFISENYHNPLPHPLIISQAFCLRFIDYGKYFGMPAITYAVEYLKICKC
jgi:hypothetical protein